MIVEAWFAVAVMLGVHENGMQDILIFKQPDHGHFHNVATCQKFIGDHPFKLAKALINEFGDRPPERIMCVPEETIESFMEEGGKRGEKT